MSVYNQLAIRIRNLRKQRKWPQEELADRAGLHRTYVSHIENAKRDISVETMCRIATAFDITPSKLMTGIKFEG